MVLQGVVILPLHLALNKGIFFCKVRRYFFFVAFLDSRVLFNKTSHTDEAKVLMVVSVSLREIFLYPEISGCTSVSLDWDKHPVSSIAVKNCQEKLLSSSSSW